MGRKRRLPPGVEETFTSRLLFTISSFIESGNYISLIMGCRVRANFCFLKNVRNQLIGMLKNEDFVTFISRNQRGCAKFSLFICYLPAVEASYSMCRGEINVNFLFSVSGVEEINVKNSHTRQQLTENLVIMCIIYTYFFDIQYREKFPISIFS